MTKSTLVIGAVLAVQMISVASPLRAQDDVDVANNGAIRLGANFNAADLSRIRVGNQAGIMKIMGPGDNVSFIKSEPGNSMQGIDGLDWAPLNDDHRKAILSALNIRSEELETVASNIETNIDGIPHKLEAVALMGMIASAPLSASDSAAPTITPRTAAICNNFLRRMLSFGGAKDADKKVRRQALLALALASQVDSAMVKDVLGFMERSRNIWESFHVPTFFKYHADAIRALNDPEIVAGIKNSGNPYADDAAAALGAPGSNPAP